MNALLWAISIGTYATGNTAWLYGSKESSLSFLFCTIFRIPKELGGGVFSLAVTVTSDLIHKDPTFYFVLDVASLLISFFGCYHGWYLFFCRCCSLYTIVLG